MFADLLQTGARKNVLRVAAAAPKDQFFAELFFQFCRRHVGRRDLHRIDDVQSDLRQIAEDIIDRAAGVQEHFDGAVFMNEAEQFFLSRFEQIAIQPRRQLQRFLCSQVIAQLNHMNAVLHALEINPQITQMGFNQSVEIVLGQLPFRNQHLHEPAVAEITLAALEQIAAELPEDGPVGVVVKPLRFAPQVGLFLCTDHAKLMPVDITQRLRVGQRMVHRIVPIAPGRTARDYRAVDDHLQGSIGVAHRMKARWNQAGGSIRQGVRPPGVQRDAEGGRVTVQLHDIGAKTVEDIRLWFSQLLEHVVELCAGERQAQMGTQTVVGDHIDAG